MHTRSALRAVADLVVKDARFRFVDGNSGQSYSSADRAPAGAALRLGSRFNDWRYWNGVLAIGIIRLGEVLRDTGYIGFSRDNIAFSFDSYPYFEKRYRGEGKWGYPFAQRFIMEELDDCGAMGAGVLEVYRFDPQRRYRSYIDQATEFILTKQYRLDDRTLVRAFPEKWTLWADDLYMSVSFLCRRGGLTGDARCIDDAALQVMNFHKYLFDDARGLMYHCWYSTPPHAGVAFWGRANGWALLAQVDLLDRLPNDHPQRPALLALLRKHVQGIAAFQSGEGLWHQLLDKSDSYLETSCSAMFTYAVARAVNRGYIEPRFGSVAVRGWEGVLARITPGGEIEGVCEGTGVGDDLVFYYHRPTPLNDPHGTGAVLLAGSEILQLERRAK
ncbi:MAG TPA: glycoside hydrolase family 88 protein [Bacteroidota bacterium]|nr:glycoside hydrolase family 88 protein [Bacteroidota bacterium]